MHFSVIDYLIIGVFFLIAVGAGFFFSRKSAESQKTVQDVAEGLKTL